MGAVAETNFWMTRRLRDAGRGDAAACFDLGMAFSSGTEGAELDLVEAHKWFNLASVWGEERGSELRIEISEEMTAREIAEAQRGARAWLAANGGTRRVA